MSGPRQDLRWSKTTTKALRKKIIEKHNGSCFMCGAKNSAHPLEISHIVPLAKGGAMSENNLIALCPSCHRLFDRQPREIEFLSFLSELLSLHQDYSNLRQEAILGREVRYRADILVDHKSGQTVSTLLIECKTYLAQNSLYVSGIISQLDAYKSAYGDCQMVLAVPATLKESDVLALTAANIDVWDLNYIANIFATQIDKASRSYYKALLLTLIVRPDGLTREQKLLDSLELCTPGRKDCYVYQTLIGEIIEFLFTPPLGKPLPELSDKSEANRRDFIVPNYVEKGFWSFMREKYEADYIVVDAKNYTRKVKKPDVLQVANYLKSHGAGLFGLIISRKGGDVSGCEHTLREQWLIHRKLILVLDDEDIRAMLVAKSDGRQPEEILAQKIERFRLSM
ncbi:endonuclease [Pseudomonas viridiflava]|uniref:HNH endonuclease n=1 Tax=Pseudomonas viridiflava TaxID=33069 RepID=UPI0010C0B0AD|nr:HNH endonuclease signature motif containing protein [Pseudomonas viridiflava]TKJ67653.1 endonuclease [Pseudomonas viridiflava]TKK33270.1 endonuclease [Pseudomonas viridiflava]